MLEGCVARPSPMAGKTVGLSMASSRTKVGDDVPVCKYVFRRVWLIIGEAVTSSTLPTCLSSPASCDLEKRTCSVFVVCIAQIRKATFRVA